MSDYLTEQEQVELLKSWVKQYSFVILAGVVLAIIAISGWRFWQQREYKIITHASSVFDEMLTKRAQNDPEATLVQAQKLFSHYRNTTYGPFAALMIARDAITKKNFSAAEEKLQWVIDHSHMTTLRQIARLRLARVLLAENKPQDSLKVLDKVDDKSFIGLVDEVKGDAYFTMQDNAKAKLAYQQALTELPNAEVTRPLLQMKYDNLVTN